MKQSFLYAWCLSAAGCVSLLHAQSVNQFPDSGPETTLDSLWAATGHMQAFSDAIDSQMGVHRFQDGKKSRFWFSGMGSFGNASVRNEHPAFDYSAGGGALGYDYCASESGRGRLLGLSLGFMSGTQNIKEMADHPAGFLEGDKFDQDTMMVNIYGALYRQTGRKSHLLLSMNMGFGNTDNKCAHHGMNYENSTWDTETWNVALSAAWRYEVSRSFSIMPFAKMSYVHASNKVKKDDYDDEGYDSSWWWDDDDEYWRRESRWENRGSFDNLALEVGVTLEHAIRFSNGMMWTNAISGSYCPDIWRNNPHHTFNDIWWDGDTVYESRYGGRGYAPARQAFKVKFLSRFVRSENLSIYASYQACFRESYTEHRAALGVAVVF